MYHSHSQKLPENFILMARIENLNHRATFIPVLLIKRFQIDYKIVYQSYW